MNNPPIETLKLPPIDIDSLPKTQTGIVDLDPEWLNVDAKTFQFKAGGDSKGVTERLKGIAQFDSKLCGIILVWQDIEGKLFIADGHQRMGLALRAKESGQSDIWMPARIYKESEGYSKDDMKVIAAFKNIAEGTGTSIDVARVIREHGDLPDSIPPNGKLVKEAKALANLSETTFGMVYNNMLPPEYGAVIGDVISKIDDEHTRDLTESAIVRAFTNSYTKPVNELEAQFLAMEVMRTGVIEAHQESLFGLDDFEGDNLIKERAEILQVAQRFLSDEITTFNFMQKRSGVLDEYIDGGKVNTELVKEKRDDLAVTQLLLDTGWKYGDIGAKLNEKAASFHGQKKRGGGESDENIQKLIDAIDQSLTISARELKLAKLKGDPSNGHITKLRASAAKDFLGAIQENLQNSDVAWALRCSLRSKRERENGEENGYVNGIF